MKQYKEAMGINKVILKGFIGGEPMIKKTSGNGHVVKINIGSPLELPDGSTRVSWNRAVFFNENAINLANGFSEGDWIKVVGELFTEHRMTPNGKLFFTEVAVQKFGFVEVPTGPNTIVFKKKKHLTTSSRQKLHQPRNRPTPLRTAALS